MTGAPTQGWPRVPCLGCTAGSQRAAVRGGAGLLLTCVKFSASGPRWSQILLILGTLNINMSLASIFRVRSIL